MTAQIIPFPKREPNPEPPPLMYLNWTGLELKDDKCTESVHFFISREAPCQCGQERWPKPA